MAGTAYAKPVGSGTHEAATGAPRPGTGREVRRRRPLPSGRPVTGAFLVSLAALGVFVSWVGTTSGPGTSFVVAAHDLAIGATLSPGDLRTVPMELPASLAATSAFDDPRALAGVRVISPIRAGELVQASALVDEAGSSGDLDVSFPIDSDRAVGGTLKPGEFVDVIATFGVGTDTYTTTVLSGSRILAVAAAGDSLTASSSRTVTLSVADAEEARALVHAVNVAKIVLVRAPGPDKSAQGGTYRAPAATAGTGG